MLSPNPRLLATRALHRVIYKSESLSDVLQDDVIQSSSEKAFIQDLCFGSLRHHESISTIIKLLLTKPLKQKDKDIECLLRLGLYQLIYQRTPDHAAVHETVNITKKLKKKWARGLINGVLRSFLRDKNAIQATASKMQPYELPHWLIKRLRKSWDDNWQEIAEGSNTKAPMFLRVNQSQNTRSEYLNLLKSNDIDAAEHPQCPTAIQLSSAKNVYDLPAFHKGSVSVQDAAAQFAGALLDCQNGMRVLDACSAPGGKTGHILETAEHLDVIAVDNKVHRLKRVSENLTRLGQQAELVTADVADTQSWWNGEVFDRILLDAPCSATGVIRRHPDIKVLRKASDIETLQQQQADMLASLWSLLKEDGLLLYATCSILPGENEQQVQRFVEQHEDAKVVKIQADWGIACEYGRQVLPGQHDMDGFYYCLIKKK